MTLRGPFMVSRKLATSVKKITGFTFKNTRPYLFLPLRVSIQNVPVCTFKTSPCVPTPRAHVSTHVRVVPVNTGTFWTDTRGRVEWTHGIFSARHTTPHTAHTRHNTRHNTPQQHDRNNTRRQRHAETEKEDREDKTTEERREKRETIHFQCGGAWPFSVDGVLCLVKPVNARVLGLLNSVKYDSSLISFSAP